MPDPHDPRGEVSASDDSDPSHDDAATSASTTSDGTDREHPDRGRPAQERSEQEIADAAELVWPTTDPETGEPQVVEAEPQAPEADASGGGQVSDQEGGAPREADRSDVAEPPPAPTDVEMTLVTEPVEAVADEPDSSRGDNGRDAGRAAGAPTPEESTQLIARIDADPSGVANDTYGAGHDVRHEGVLDDAASDDVEATDPGVSRSATGGRSGSGTAPASNPDPGSPTMRMRPVGDADDRPTQQIPLPDLNAPTPHEAAANAEDLQRTDPDAGGVRGAGPAAQPRPPERTEPPARTAARSAGPPGFEARDNTNSWADLDGYAADDEPTDDADTAAESGEGGRRIGRRGVLVTGALLAVVVIAAGVVLAWPGLVGSGERPRADPPAPVRLRSHIKPVDGSAPAPTRSGLEAALGPVVSNPALGTFGGVVIDGTTGRTLWQRKAGNALAPASTAKVLTTGAALLALDHDFRFTTRVVRGSEPGSVVLVAGGDPTLSGLPENSDSVYPGAAHLAELVAEVRKATGGNVTSVKVDLDRYAGPGMARGWLPADVGNGYVAPMEPVMLSGGRADPTENTSPRSKTPALDAGRELAERLGVPGSSVSVGSAPEQARELGSVRSAPLRRMVRTTLLHSDNVLAEALARQVAVATGHEPSFSGAARAVRDVLSRRGFDLTGTKIVDGSGLSVHNRITPRLLGSVFGAAAAPLRSESDGTGRATTAKLRPLLRSVPIAGGTGSLADRYESAAAAGQGWVRAKTGTLTDVNTLAGTVVTRDGRLLVFALMSNGTGSTDARPALDAVAATLRGCGCQ